MQNGCFTILDRVELPFSQKTKKFVGIEKENSMPFFMPKIKRRKDERENGFGESKINSKNATFNAYS